MCKVNFCQTALILLAEIIRWGEQVRLRNLASGFKRQAGE